MTETELISRWERARLHIILSQLGPIVLLTSTIALLQAGLADTPILVRMAMAGILLATGVLGAAAQFAAATEGGAIATDLASLEPTTAIGQAVAGLGRWVDLVRFGTPALFVLIFVLLLVALFIPGVA